MSSKAPVLLHPNTRLYVAAIQANARGNHLRFVNGTRIEEVSGVDERQVERARKAERAHITIERIKAGG